MVAGVAASVRIQYARARADAASQTAPTKPGASGHWVRQTNAPASPDNSTPPGAAGQAYQARQPSILALPHSAIMAAPSASRTAEVQRPSSASVRQSPGPARQSTRLASGPRPGSAHHHGATPPPAQCQIQRTQSQGRQSHGIGNVAPAGPARYMVTGKAEHQRAIDRLARMQGCGVGGIRQWHPGGTKLKPSRPRLVLPKSAGFQCAPQRRDKCGEEPRKFSARARRASRPRRRCTHPTAGNS